MPKPGFLGIAVPEKIPPSETNISLKAKNRKHPDMR